MAWSSVSWAAVSKWHANEHHLQVPDSVARSLRLPEGEAEDRLRVELAISVYSQDILSFGKACELS
jgi:hypothetical protein